MKIFADYPAPPGNKHHVIGEFTGPASYATVVVATPSTGGIQITAQELGLVDIEMFVVTGCYGGSVEAVVFPNGYDGPCKSVTVMARVATTGAEKAAEDDLSGATFRFWAVGH